MRRVAAIDCGTNSLRLLVADVADGAVRDVVRTMRIVRLGEGVDRTRRFDPRALQRTFAVCREYGALLAELDVERLRFVATSATRDATNRDEFFSGVRDILGVEPEVISGEDEAAFSFLGATYELRGRAEFPTPYLVVDIGGGSTEFVLGVDRPQAMTSVDIGCVRLTERHIRSDPPSASEIEALRADIRRALDTVSARLPLTDAATVVGLAGSVTTVAALDLGLAEYDPRRIHHTRIPATRVHAIAEKLLAMSHEERAAQPVIHPGRVDVIAAGALVLDEVLQRARADAVVVSEHDILDGIVRAMVDEIDER